MSTALGSPRFSQAGGAQFTTTHWSEVSAAGGAFVVGVCETLQKFGHPLYAFVFRPGCAPMEAQELTQGIFAKLLLSG